MKFNELVKKLILESDDDIVFYFPSQEEENLRDKISKLQKIKNWVDKNKENLEWNNSNQGFDFYGDVDISNLGLT